MKHNKKSSVVLCAVLFALYCGSRKTAFCESPLEKVSRPFEYTGYSIPEYKNYLKTSEYVAMFDGTKLAIDVYLPSDGPHRVAFPILFNFTPYKRAVMDPKTGEPKQASNFPGMEKFIQFFTQHGYGIAIADVRGSGASFGSRLDMEPQLARDGKQLVDWMEAQSWCDGNVGMFGGSYLGWTTYAVAGEKPRALKAIMSEVTAFDFFPAGLPYSEGIYRGGLRNAPASMQALFDQGFYRPDGPIPMLYTAPVVDEDGDGQLSDEIPLDLNSDGLFIDDPPTYSDGAKRSHIYYRAVKEHTGNYLMGRWAPEASFRNSKIADTPYTWMDIMPGYRPARIAESGIALYHVGAWFDAFPRDTARWYATLKNTNPSKMLIHPSTHSSPDITPVLKAGPYWKTFGEDIELFPEKMFKERLRFFDRYLKGIRNGVENDLPVAIYVMNGEGWRFENEWPLTRQQIQTFYLDGENTLSKKRSVAGSDLYRVDFGHDSRYGSINFTRWGGGVLEQPMTRTQKDLRCLTYTTNPLDTDTEVTGHPLFYLYVSSTAAHGDVYVYLEDVDKNGEVFYVTEGKIRAGFAGLMPDEEMLPSDAKMEVLPDLPYHGFRDTDYVDGIFAGGKVVELVLDLCPTSWVFKNGHRIRVSIACADWPTFELHPKLSPKNDPKDPQNIIPTVTVYRDGGHPSRIELPVIPKKS